MNTNFKVIGLTRLEIKPESIAPEADVLSLGRLSCEPWQVDSITLQTAAHFFDLLQ